MRLFTAPRLALAALVPALFVLSVIPGCSNGGEGERCGDPPPYGSINDGDCGSGLVCLASSTLQNGTSDQVNRCCYADHVSDSRCARVGNTSATNTASGGASASDAGAPSSDAGSNNSVAGGGSSSMTADLPAGAGGA